MPGPGSGYGVMTIMNGGANHRPALPWDVGAWVRESVYAWVICKYGFAFLQGGGVLQMGYRTEEWTDYGYWYWYWILYLPYLTLP